jgi:LacI family transcriptional regulator
MSITIYDIAKKAKVSSAAVSNIVNSNKEHKFSKETVKRVKRIATELGYKTNHFAKALRQGKTNIIGITQSGVSTLSSYDDPYFSEIVSGVGGELGRRNQKLLLHSYESKHSQTFQTRELVDGHIVDGIIVVLFSDLVDYFTEHELPYLKHMNIPFVAVHSLARELGCASVGIDPVKVGRTATEHLVRHGYKDITGVFPADPQGHYRGLQDGFCGAMREAGLKAGIETFKHSYTITPPAMELAQRILGSGKLPRAFFTCSDDLAEALLIRLRQQGKRVPEDVALVAFSGQSGDERIVSEITCVHQPSYEKGRLAAQLLQKKLADPAGAEEKTSVLETQLVVRYSCGCG